MSEVTQILQQIEAGDPNASEQLLPLVYDELRKLAYAKMASESPDHTLQATALVHEAYVRLVNVKETPRWDSRGHFFSAAAEAMRRILIECARKKNTIQRGNFLQRIELHNEIRGENELPHLDLLALDEVLTKLEAIDPEKAQLVKLRFFAGMTIPDAAKAMGISSSTADNYWAYARCWLKLEMRDCEDQS